MRLDDAINEFMAMRKSIGYATNTTKVERRALDYLLGITGNIHVRNLTAEHGERYLADLTAKGFKPSTLNLYRGVIRRFCDWAAKRRYMTGGSIMMNTRRYITDAPPRRRVPSTDFSRLLDSCSHPQQRIIVALGLYLFLRSSEVIHLDVQHVNLEAGTILVYQPKTKRFDEMPISRRLDAELRRWLTWYAQDVAEKHGPLDGRWPLVPPRSKMTLANDGTGKGGGYPVVPDKGQVNPTRRVNSVHLKVQDALRTFGWEVSSDDREGGHTLRRSGARALYETLVNSDSEARDEAIGMVQSMLHHKTRAQTEHYIGLEASREKRDKLLRGADMFGEDELADNVVQLRQDDVV